MDLSVLSQVAYPILQSIFILVRRLRYYFTNSYLGSQVQETVQE